MDDHRAVEAMGHWLPNQTLNRARHGWMAATNTNLSSRRQLNPNLQRNGLKKRKETVDVVSGVAFLRASRVGPGQGVVFSSRDYGTCYGHLSITVRGWVW
jgi:hypothetical protein